MLRDPFFMPRTSECKRCGLVISKLGRDSGWHEDVSNTRNAWPGGEIKDGNVCAGTRDGLHVPGFIST